MNRHRLRDIARMAACVALLAACAKEGPPTPASTPAVPKTMLSLKELMDHVIDPAADAFWLASGTIITEKGETNRAPTTDAGWEPAINGAAILIESSNLLTMAGRARDERWMQYAKELGAAAQEGMKAAKAKDERAVFDTGGRIYRACLDCHMKYLLGYP